MTNLILVRHGESEGNKMRIIQGKMNIFSLTQEGRRQVMVAPDKKTLKKSVKSMFFMVQTRCEVETIKY